MSLPGGAVRRPVAVAMLFLAVLLLGGISFGRLPINLLPEVSYPRLVIHTTYPQVAPEEVERMVTRSVEAQAAAVPGVEGITSLSREGVSLVTVRFAWGTEMDFAMLNLRERMDNVRTLLPETASRPRILRVDPDAEPIMALTVSGGADLWETRELAESVFRRRLEQLDGVAQASVTGGLEREIHVEVDPWLLEGYGLSLEEVEGALARANISAPGGTILQGRYRYPLRTLGEFRAVHEMGEVVVARQAQEGSGGAFRLIHLRDVAVVRDGFADGESEARHNGVEAVGLLVFKEAGANTVAAARAVERAVGLLREEFPAMTLQVAASQAGFISASIRNVVQALLTGSLLAFLVLFLFLRDTRYPVAVALAIPISVVGTFALMEATGVTLNIMSLGGLALGVGMLVDNSIVVLENVFRHREEGGSALAAAALGAEEVQGAITASTLTTISVFVPIIYVDGVAGALFRDLSLTVAFSLLVSLAVALTLLPTLAAGFGGGAKGEIPTRPDSGEGSPPVDPIPPPGPGGRRGGGRRAAIRLPGTLLRGAAATGRELLAFWWGGIRRVGRALFSPGLDAFERGFTGFARGYHRTLEGALDRRGLVLAIAGGTLVAAAALALALDRDLLPQVDQGAFQVRLELEEGTSLEVTSAVARELEGRILSDPGVASVFTRVGRDVESRPLGGDQAMGLHTALLQVQLLEGARTGEVIRRVRGVAQRYPPGAVAFEAGGATALGRILGGGEADVAVRIRGEGLEAAHRHAEAIRDRLALVPFLGNVRVASERGQPELQVEIRHEVAAGYGIDARQIAGTVERAMRGSRATEFVDFDRKIGVVVRYPTELRFSRATLEGIRVEGVPLRELAEIRETLGPSEIRREAQGRVVSVHADVLSGGLDRAIGAIQAELAGIPAPAGLQVEVGGENEEMRRSFRDLAFAFALALLLVYMILAAQFESFVHPATILAAVPLALVGAILALALAGEGLNTMSLIGVVILVGIVVNDSIVKVDFIRQARERGASAREAILEAGRVRLRPIVMTTVTTVLGLTPMALGLGEGADLRAPLAIAVIGGLLVATALTLLVVPVMYAVVEEFRLRFAAPPEEASPDVGLADVGGGAGAPSGVPG